MEIECYNIVYYPQKDGSYVKYIVRRKDGDELIVTTVDGRLQNWVMTTDVISQEQFESQYNNEIIYE